MRSFGAKSGSGKLICALCLVFAILCPSAAFFARGDQKKPRVPVVQKQALVVQSDLLDTAARIPSWVGGSSSFLPLAFLGSRFLIVASTTPEGEAAYSPRAVHCVLLDARTGNILGERQGPVVKTQVSVLPARNGRFLLRKNHELALYSPPFKELARFPRDSRSRDIPGLGYLVQSTPGRRLVAVQKWLENDTKIEITGLDTDTLAVRGRRLSLQKYG